MSRPTSTASHDPVFTAKLNKLSEPLRAALVGGGMGDPGLLAAYPRTGLAEFGLLPAERSPRRRRLHGKAPDVLACAVGREGKPAASVVEEETYEVMASSAGDVGLEEKVRNEREDASSECSEGRFHGVSHTRDSPEAARSASQRRASPRTGIPSGSPFESFPGTVTDSASALYTSTGRSTPTRVSLRVRVTHGW